MPEIFSIIPKEQLVEIMKSVFENEDMEIVLTAPKIDSVAAKETIEGKDYSKLWYKNEMKTKFKGDSAPDSSVAIMLFEQKFGAGSTTYNPSTGFYSIVAKKETIAATSDGKNWKFIERDEDQEEVIKKILPPEILD